MNISLRHAEKGHPEIGARLLERDELPRQQDHDHPGRQFRLGAENPEYGRAGGADAADPFREVGGILPGGEIGHSRVEAELSPFVHFQ